MVVDPTPVHGDMGQQVRHRFACGEWIGLGASVDLHEVVPGASAMLLEEGSPLLLEFLVSVSGDDMHHTITMRDRGLQLRLAAECRPVHLAIPS
jgi:hypothetical protein